MKGSLIFSLFLAILTILCRYEHSLLFYALFFLVFLFSFFKYSKKYFVFIPLFFYFYRPNIKYEVPTKQQEYTIRILVKKENYCIVKNEKNQQKYIFYPKDMEVSENMILSLQGCLERISRDGNLYGFQWKDYLKKQRIYYQFSYYEDIQILSAKQKLNQKIIASLLARLPPNTHTIIKMLLFNDKDVDLYENIQNLNASYLFIVSGFHILIFYSILNRFFCFFFKKNGWISSICILLFYLFLLDFSISALRAFLCLLCKQIDQKQKGNTLDYLGIAGCISLLIEPLYIYNYSFIMSYLCTFILIICQNCLKKQTKTFQNISLSFLSFFAIFPIILYMNYKINFLSVFSNIFLGYCVQYIFIFCLFMLILPIPFLDFICSWFIKILHFLSSLGKPLLFGCPSTLFILSYYFLFFFFIFFWEENKTKSLAITLFLCFALCFLKYNQNEFIPYEQVTFLDVNQGDCCIIENKYNEGVILIDTGGLKNYDIAKKRILPFLEYKGIRKIDTIFISHDDYDHMGALEPLILQIPIQHIVTNPDLNDYLVGKLYFENLNKNASNYQEKNQQSMVLKVKVANLNFLFTGDIDYQVEQEIVNNYPDLKVDILKVAHHGSKTSTSDIFLQQIQPKIAVISVGKNNPYHHPSSDVLSRLQQQQILIFRTDIHGSITFSYRWKRYYLKTAK